LSPSRLGVERGPSPPLLSLVPLSPPPSYLATPSGTAQTSLPVSASNATHTSRSTPSLARRTRVNALPLLAVIELKPSFSGTFQSWCGPSFGQARRIFSAVVPSWFDPRNCGQSAAPAGHRAQNVSNAIARFFQLILFNFRMF